MEHIEVASTVRERHAVSSRISYHEHNEFIAARWPLISRSTAC